MLDRLTAISSTKYASDVKVQVGSAKRVSGKLDGTAEVKNRKTRLLASTTHPSGLTTKRAFGGEGATVDVEEEDDLPNPLHFLASTASQRLFVPE